MTQPSPLSDKERADLVAYLDGELDEAAARALETKLNLDPAARAEAETLRRTWELLDYLPRPEPSPRFTHRTLDRLSARELRPAAARPRRWLWIAGWVAAVLLAAAVGYLAAVRLVPAQTGGQGAEQPCGPSEEDLVRDLRLIENLRFYEQVETLDFLKELDRLDLFGEDPLDS